MGALKIRSSNVATILSDHLSQRKVSSCWVPHNVMEAEMPKLVERCQAAVPTPRLTW